jgi:hypothetical protein
VTEKNKENSFRFIAERLPGLCTFGRVAACIPSQRQRFNLPGYDPLLYRQRHRIATMFARLKDWRRIRTRYDRCVDFFMAAITLAVIFLFWINESSCNCGCFLGPRLRRTLLVVES